MYLRTTQGIGIAQPQKYGPMTKPYCSEFYIGARKVRIRRPKRQLYMAASHYVPCLIMYRPTLITYCRFTRFNPAREKLTSSMSLRGQRCVGCITWPFALLGSGVEFCSCAAVVVSRGCRSNLSAPKYCFVVGPYFHGDTIPIPALPTCSTEGNSKLPLRCLLSVGTMLYVLNEPHLWYLRLTKD